MREKWNNVIGDSEEEINVIKMSKNYKNTRILENMKVWLNELRNIELWRGKVREKYDRKIRKRVLDGEKKIRKM